MAPPLSSLLPLTLLAGSSLVQAVSPLKDCLEPAISKVAFEGDPLYQLTAVKRYNLDIDVSPAAVTYPSPPKRSLPSFVAPLMTDTMFKLSVVDTAMPTTAWVVLAVPSWSTWRRSSTSP